MKEFLKKNRVGAIVGAAVVTFATIVAVVVKKRKDTEEA